jgi:7-cyano-7-deazaguanine tRNA-ribosyltransferase
MASFSIKTWDGLAKIGLYETQDHKMITPALFPVVDPYKQDIKISDLRSKFGFDQVITSAYLMSKRMGEKKISEFPLIHDYLDYDGLVMMDSGAYQYMMYGDIDLTVESTMEIQNHVKTEIGVIMDHPIGYNIPHREAIQRNETTIKNLKQSIPLFEGSDVNWTLPIQGGKYIDLLSDYLDKVTDPKIIDKFSFYALGSVVPVMINQDYVNLVKMIATARAKLPVTFPLHLFGAGHPAMFALAVFLGIDTFDSAAYILMAKDNRYMTVDGTQQLENLRELPCNCPICVTYTPEGLLKLDKHTRRTKLAEHNLYVSAGEIRNIHNAIRTGRLWDLVQQRANSVPNLARATRLAVEYVTTGMLADKYQAGIPVSKRNAIRVSLPIDIIKPEITRTKRSARRTLLDIQPKELILITFNMEASIYNRIPPQITDGLKIPAGVELALMTPLFGIIPYGIYDIYPMGQITHDLDIEHFNLNEVVEQLEELKNNGLVKITIIHYEKWPQKILDSMLQLVNGSIIETDKPNRILVDLF